MSNNVRKRKGGYPTIDQFHSILARISPHTQFSKSAIDGLRESYLEYIGQVASSLTQWDSLKEEDKIVEALHVNKSFQGYVAEAQPLVAASSARKLPPKKPKKRKLTTADAEEQERLLEKSKKAFENKDG